MKIRYFDHAATTAVAEEVKDEMLPYFTENYGNASALYDLGKKSKEAINIARGRVARAINAKPNEIYFTSCGTESDNLILKGIAKAYRNKGNHIITSKIEHPAILNSCRSLEKEGVRVTYLNVDKNGFVDLRELEKAINKDTILISIMMANNEIGTIEPVQEIAEIAHINNVIFHTDAVQAIGNIKIDVKIYGPKGVGVLYVDENINFVPIQNGGHQEDDKRAGTENVAGIVGLGKAIEIANQGIEEYNNKLLNLRNYFLERIRVIPYTKINGDLDKRLSGNINISFLGVDNRDIMKELNKKGICVSAGSACSSGFIRTSHVLSAIGLSEGIARGTIRITFGRENTKEDIDYLVDILEETIKKLRIQN